MDTINNQVLPLSTVQHREVNLKIRSRPAVINQSSNLSAVQLLLFMKKIR